MEKFTFDYQQYENHPEKIQTLWEAAHIDSLTKLYNRYGMEQWITEHLQHQKTEQISALLMIDVDNFKTINDGQGHMYGDAILVEIADIIREVFGEEYFCGRIGGDEYEIFAYDVKKRKKILELAELLLKKQSPQVSLSIGIAFSLGNTNRYAELFTKADQALYQAKALGKNRYFVYHGIVDTKEKIKIPQNRSEREAVVRIGESGFSLSKVLLDEVIQILRKQESPKAAIEEICHCIVEAFDVTRAYASCYSEDEQHVIKSYFYAQDNSVNIKVNVKFSGREYEKKFFNQDSIFFCTDIEQTMEPMKTEMKKMGVQTMLQVLIHKDGKIIGTLGINNCGYKRLWLQDEIETVHTIALLMQDTIYKLQQEK